MVKTITITEEAYERIKRAKSDTESFSQFFIKKFEKKMTIKDLAEFGKKYKISDKEADEWIERIHRRRKEDTKEQEKRDELIRHLFNN